MLQLKDTRFQNTSHFIDAALSVASHYGFMPMGQAPQKNQQDLKAMRERAAKNETEIAFARREERAVSAAAKKCATCSREGGPLLLWRIGEQGRERSLPTTIELHVVGSTSGIAEALLIFVADAILREAGVAKRIVQINSIGSPESSNRFVRDVGSYLRKHIESISPTLRPRAATDPLGTLVTLIERGHPAIPRAPQATEYLIEEERKRFWDVLEYLEVAGLPYELSPFVLGSRDCWQHALFQIASVGEDGTRLPLAFGGRYDPLASRHAGGLLPAVTISIACEARGKSQPDPETSNVSPSIYFAHLGIEARRRGLAVLETLRASGIPVCQGLVHERLGDQMAIAQRLAAPYILIMGHKEAVENTMLVREIATNYQEAVPLPELPTYLKRRRIALA